VQFFCIKCNGRKLSTASNAIHLSLRPVFTLGGHSAEKIATEQCLQDDHQTNASHLYLCSAHYWSTTQQQNVYFLKYNFSYSSCCVITGNEGNFCRHLIAFAHNKRHEHVLYCSVVQWYRETVSGKKLKLRRQKSTLNVHLFKAFAVNDVPRLGVLNHIQPIQYLYRLLQNKNDFCNFTHS